jgi:hypothetical protein
VKKWVIRLQNGRDSETIQAINDASTRVSRSDLEGLSNQNSPRRLLPSRLVLKQP